MTMVLPSQYDIVETHLCPQQQNHLHNYSSPAAISSGELESIRRRFPLNPHQSTPSSSSPAYCNNNSFQTDGVLDKMADGLRPDNDPNQPSSSRVDESWLCLRLGSDNNDQSQSSSTPDQRRRRGGLVELDLLPATTTNSSHNHQQQVIISRPPGFFHLPPEFRAPPPRPVVGLRQRIPASEMNILMTGQQQQQQQIIGGNYFLANLPASMSSLMPMSHNFFPRPNFDDAQMGLNGPSSSRGMRVIRPPRRPHVGIWFMLHASQNQVREPFLPQIPSSYLRIKNARMTVRLLMKYLVQKLGLESESEVEIRCRGQELQPILTLLHVRDNIWCTRREMPFTLLTDSPFSSPTLPSGVDSHIMILHYGRALLTATATAATTSSCTPIF